MSPTGAWLCSGRYFYTHNKWHQAASAPAYHAANSSPEIQRVRKKINQREPTCIQQMLPNVLVVLPCFLQSKSTAVAAVGTAIAVHLVDLFLLSQPFSSVHLYVPISTLSLPSCSTETKTASKHPG